jgi:3-oxoacyl-[acyl-carrier protein] reductase
MELKNKVVLITGATRGIGKATSIKFAKEKVSLILNYNSNHSAAQETKAECLQYTDEVTVIQADITLPLQRKGLFEDTKAKYSTLDVLVNNAGGYWDNSDCFDSDYWQKTFDLNLFAQVACTDSALKLMTTGQIINVSSFYGKVGYGDKQRVAYAASKAALDSFTKNIAKTLSPNISVNAVAPGYTKTESWGELSKEAEELFSKDLLINRFVSPEEVADAIIFLAKNDAVTGEILTIDGGLSLKDIYGES